MGSFYCNVTLLGVDVDAVRAAYRDPAFVAVSGADLVVFAAADDEGALRIGSGLSGALDCMGLGAGVHDDDILFLEVYDRGRVTFTGSVPDAAEYFDVNDDDGDEDDEMGGTVDGSALVAALGQGDAPALQAALARDYVFATERHAAVVDALRLPEAAVGWGYRYLAEPRPAGNGPAAEPLHP